MMEGLEYNFLEYCQLIISNVLSLLSGTLGLPRRFNNSRAGFTSYAHAYAIFIELQNDYVITEKTRLMPRSGIACSHVWLTNIRDNFGQRSTLQCSKVGESIS